MSRREFDWANMMRAACAGDAVAYDRLLREVAAALRPRIRSALRGLAPSEEEDVVQEILIAVHLKRKTWDPDRPLGPWLRAVANHKTIDILRRRGRERHVSIDDFVEILPAEEAAHSVSECDVRRSLDTLPNSQRQVIETMVLNGKTPSEAAEQLGMTQGAVRVAFHRALNALAERDGLP